MIGVRSRVAVPGRYRDRHFDSNCSELLGDGSPGERVHEMLISYATETFLSCERTVALREDQVEPVVLQAVLSILAEPVGGTGGTN